VVAAVLLHLQILLTMCFEPLGYLQIPLGLKGDAGADGKTIRSGSGAPSSSVGVNGDFYLDTSAMTIYGPKSGGVWGSGVNLIGDNGLSLLNGSGAPSSGLGVNGDFYIDTTADAIYGPKTAGAWGSPTSLIGPTGASGTTRLYERLTVATSATVSPTWASFDTYTILANTLVNNGDALIVNAWVNYTTNSPGGSFYRMRLLLNSASTTDDGTGEPALIGAIPNNIYYKLTVEIIKKSSSVALCRYTYDVGGSAGTVIRKQLEISGLDFTTGNTLNFGVIQFASSVAQLQSLTIDKISS
jgi:hypothetical protein